MKDYMDIKIQGFQQLTGATINVVKASTPITWYQDVNTDIQGLGSIDLYSIFGNWIPTMAEKGHGLLDISQNVREQVGLDWFDIMPAVRSGVATYKKRVYGIPVDGDVIIMLYRTDLVEDVGLPTPNSWDDVLKIIDYYADQDINGDGAADYANCFSTKSKEIASAIFWAIASSFLQTKGVDIKHAHLSHQYLNNNIQYLILIRSFFKGTSQGAFFDPETFDPISATHDKFGDLLEVYKKLVQQSPFRDNGETGWQDTLQLFQEGRCVLWYNYPGPTKILVSNQVANNMTGILRYAPLPGMKCTDNIECPHMRDGVSHAPFLANGGYAFAVNNRSATTQQKMALDFSFYISDPDISYHDVAYPKSFLDPLRLRHTAALTNVDSPQSRAFLENGW